MADIQKDYSRPWVDFGFKFKIGDVVTHRGFTPLSIRLDRDGKKTRTTNRKHRLMVSERQIIDCPGGTQWLYICRGLFNEAPAGEDLSLTRRGGQTFTTDHLKLNEVELISWEESEELDREAEEITLKAWRASRDTGGSGSGASGSGGMAQEPPSDTASGGQ